jgi:hypothetical protein
MSFYLTEPKIKRFKIGMKIYNIMHKIIGILFAVLRGNIKITAINQTLGFTHQ